MKRAATWTCVTLIVLGVLQLVFAAICAYMIAAINDNVWNGVKLDDLAFTAAMVGSCTLGASMFAGLWSLEA